MTRPPAPPKMRKFKRDVNCTADRMTNIDVQIEMQRALETEVSAWRVRPPGRVAKINKRSLELT
jgi:hypothetical protein|eukprot:128169-Prymnesium_polylepis.2